MKKYLLIITLAFASVVAMPKLSNAQSGYFLSAGIKTDHKADTLSNANTVNITLAINGYQKVVSIQPLITKLTGTTAGTVVLYGANSINSAFVPCPSRRTDGTYRLDTLTLSNVSTVQSKGFIVENSPYAIYQIRAVGTGTQSTQIKGFAIWRKD